MKKIIFCLSTVVLWLCGYSETAFSNGYWWEYELVSGGDEAVGGGARITGVFTDVDASWPAEVYGALSFPSRLGGYNVISISMANQGDGWCENLTAVTLPATLREIGSYVFSGASKLTTIAIPDSIVRIEWCAFEDSGLTSIRFPSGLKYLGYDSLNGTSISTLDIPASLIDLDYEDFSELKYLKSITVDGANPKYSSDSQGFLYTKDKTELLAVPALAESITILASVKNIDTALFGRSACAFTVESGNPAYKITNNALYSKDGATLIAVPRNVGDFNIERTARKIRRGAFSYCYNLTQLVVPNGVLEVGTMVSCEKLERINLPESVRSIGGFRSCPLVSELAVPSCVTELPNSCFWGCSNLSEVFLPVGLTKIGQLAFRRCQSLSCVYLPAGVSIGWSAFSYPGPQSLTLDSISTSHGLSYSTGPMDIYILGSIYSSSVSPEKLFGNGMPKDVTMHHSMPISAYLRTRDKWDSVKQVSWSPQSTVLIQFDAKGGECNETSRTYYLNGPVYGGFPPAYREGYWFEGWWTDPSGGTKVRGSDRPSSSRTLFAHWSEITNQSSLTVNFNANGGSGTMSPQAIAAGASAALSANGFSRTGYTFVGWSANADSPDFPEYGDKDVLSSSDYEGSVTLYAVWRKNKITITFNPNGGTCSTKSVVASLGATVSLPTPVRNGYKFLGWDGFWGIAGPVLDSWTYRTDFSHTDDFEVEACWQEMPKWPTSYRTSFGSSDLRLVQQGDVYYNPVVMDPGGASGAQRLYEGLVGGDYPAPECPYSRDGYQFSGWNYYSCCWAGSSSFYCQGINCGGLVGLRQPGDVLNICGVSALVATWTQTPKITVSFNANGGSCATSSKSVTPGSTYGDLPTPTRSGYSFEGWYTSSSGGTRITASSSLYSNASHTLYAHWTGVSYTVFFNANGGSCGTSSKTVTCGSTYGMLPTPSREGATFQGWYTSASSGTQISSGTSVSITSSQTLYAHWSVAQYVISFNGNGGSCSESSRAREYGATYGTLPTPTRTGFSFIGWFTSASGGAQVTSATVAVDDVTIYAHWTLSLESNNRLYSGVFADNSGASSCDTTKFPAVTNTVTRPEMANWSHEDGGENNKTVVYWGEMYFPAGTYRIGGSYDDYLYVKIDEKVIIASAWTSLAFANVTFETAGWHPIELRFHNAGGLQGDSYAGSFSGWTFGKCLAIQDVTSNPQSTDRSPGNFTVFGLDSEGNEIPGIFRLSRNVIINFDANGGACDVAKITLERGDAVGALPMPTRTGYSFVGWFTSSSGGTQVSPETTATDSTTLYAHWTANAYSISYDANGGSGEMSSSPTHYDADTTLSSCAFTRKGYRFCGWATSLSGAVTYTNGQSIKNLTATDGAEVTLYAVWEPAGIRVNYFRQRYPWNGLVDLEIVVTGDAWASYPVVIHAVDGNGKALAVKTIGLAAPTANGNPVTLKTGSNHIVWDAMTDLGEGYKCDSVSMRATLVTDLEQ